MARKSAPSAFKAEEKGDKQKEPEKQASSALVVMVRDGNTADVHPSEVENWKAAGWTIK